MLNNETGNETGNGTPSNADLSAHITEQWVGSTTSSSSSVLQDNFASSKPLKELCPACFGQFPPAEIAFISFDGCMQQRRLKGRMKEDPLDERHNKLMFVDEERMADGTDVLLFNLQYAYDLG
jgi:hypothetical protein